VQVDPSRLDGHVTGLGLDGFQSHARLSESGETGVTELVASGPLEAGPLTGSPHDHVHPVCRQTFAPARALQGHEDPIGRSTTRPLQPQVLTHRSKEGV
jgi:hypothetical protein